MSLFSDVTRRNHDFSQNLLSNQISQRVEDKRRTLSNEIQERGASNTNRHTLHDVSKTTRPHVTTMVMMTIVNNANIDHTSQHIPCITYYKVYIVIPGTWQQSSWLGTKERRQKKSKLMDDELGTMQTERRKHGINIATNHKYCTSSRVRKTLVVAKKGMHTLSLQWSCFLFSQKLCNLFFPLLSGGVQIVEMFV